MKRLAVVALALVDRGVRDAAKVVEDVALRCADGLALEEAVDELLQAVLRAEKEAHLGGGALGEHLGELAELEEGDRGIAREVLLGLRPEGDEARVMVREVGEVRGGGGGHRWPARAMAWGPPADPDTIQGIGAGESVDRRDVSACPSASRCPRPAWKRAGIGGRPAVDRPPTAT